MSTSCKHSYHLATTTLYFGILWCNRHLQNSKWLISKQKAPAQTHSDFTTSMSLEVTARFDFFPGMLRGCPTWCSDQSLRKIISKDFGIHNRMHRLSTLLTLKFLFSAVTQFSKFTIFPAIFSQPWSYKLHHSGPLWKQQLTKILEHDEIPWTRLTPTAPRQDNTP